MKLKLRLVLVAIVVACLAPTAVADPNFILTGVGPDHLAGLYTGPYIAQINGVGGIEVICDDFNTSTWVNKQWYAHSTAVNTIDGSTDTVKFTEGRGYDNVPPPGSAVDVGQQQAYAMAAYLAVKLVNAPSALDRGILNYAIWSIFARTDVQTPIQRLAAYYGAGSETITKVKAAWNDATKNAGSVSQYAHVTIWTPDLQPDNDSQEFITVSVPESSAVAMILFDMFAVGGLLFFVRRRRASALS